MNKLIVENRTDMPMLDALVYVRYVMGEGRVSETGKGKQYCFCTVFKDGIVVSTDLNKKSDKFIVYREVEHEA